MEKNVDEDEDAYQELLALGWRSVPVTVTPDGAVAGFDEARLRALVRSVAAPQ